MSDRGDSPPRPPRKRPSTTSDRNSPIRHAGSRPPAGRRPWSPPNVEQPSSQRQTPRSSENDPSYRRSIVYRHDSEPTSEHYVYASDSRERSAIDSGQRPSPEATHIQPGRTSSGKPPTAYRREQHNQQASLARDQPAHLAQRLSYSEQQSFQPRRQSSSHQRSEEPPHHPDTSRLSRIEEAISDDYEQEFQNLDIRDQAQWERQRALLTTPIITQNNPSHIPISRGPTTYEPNALIPPGHAIIGQVPVSAYTAPQITSASPLVSRPSESTFRTTLSLALLNFANVPRNGWKTLQVLIQNDPSLVAENPKLFLTEAIHAYVAGKDEYANQCIHRVALLQLLAKCKLNTALSRMSRIANHEPPEARDFYNEYDRIRKSGKEGAKLVASRNSGPTDAQNPPGRQTVSEASDDGYLRTVPRSELSEVARQQLGRPLGSPQISAIHGPDTPKTMTEIRAHYPLSLGFPGSKNFNRSDLHTKSLSAIPGTSGNVGRNSHPGQKNFHPSPGSKTFKSGRDNSTRCGHSNPPGLHTPNFAKEISTKSDYSNNPGTFGQSAGQGDDPDEGDNMGGMATYGISHMSVSSTTLTDISITGENTFHLRPVQESKVSKLDPRYRVRPDSRTFYKLGKVFAVLWHEPDVRIQPRTSDKGYTTAKQVWTKNAFGDTIRSTRRRMVVVREGHGYCVCIQINTYSGRGLRKFQSAQQVRDIQAVNSHSIIYMEGTVPAYLPTEPHSTKRPIEVRATDGQELERDSRLCYSQRHTVQHNVKAMDIGEVTSGSLPYLLHYYTDAQQK